MNKQNISKLVLAGALAALTAVILTADVFNGTLTDINRLRSVSHLSDHLINNPTFEKLFMNINGVFSGITDMKNFFNDIGIYVTEDKYILSPSAKTSTDYETENMIALKKYLDKKGIDLIYVNQPTKYLDDDAFFEYFGTETYSNRNTDLFLKRISEAGVNCIDLRDETEKDGMDIKSMFYRTDHHWTTETGLWAAGKIAGALNRYADYDIDLSIYDPSNYTFASYKECWVGEQGTKLSEAFMGRDDYTVITPDFPTSFRSSELDGVQPFDELITCRKPEDIMAADVYTSHHYFYQLLPLINNNVHKGKVLMLCDSFANVCEPFLALGVSEIVPEILRSTDKKVPEMIESGDYDTVLVCYAQFMIGAHDDENSSNYEMFSFGVPDEAP